MIFSSILRTAPAEQSSKFSSATRNYHSEKHPLRQCSGSKCNQHNQGMVVHKYLRKDQYCHNPESTMLPRPPSADVLRPSRVAGGAGRTKSLTTCTKAIYGGFRSNRKANKQPERKADGSTGRSSPTEITTGRLWVQRKGKYCSRLCECTLRLTSKCRGSGRYATSSEKERLCSITADKAGK